MVKQHTLIIIDYFCFFTFCLAVDIHVRLFRVTEI